MSNNYATLYISKDDAKKYEQAADALYKVDCNISKVLHLILPDIIKAANKITAANIETGDCKNFRDYDWKLSIKEKPDE